MPVKNNSRFMSSDVAVREITSYNRKAKEQALLFLRSSNERRRLRAK